MRNKLFAALTFLIVFSGSNTTFARSQLYQGKCGFLLSNSFTDRCSALFSKGILTLMPSGGPQERIYPTQIESYSLSSEETIKVNEDVDKWQKLFPEQTTGFLFFKKKTGIPKWVVDATSKKVTQHKFVINYVDSNLLPRKALFVLDDEGQAASMQLSLRKTTSLYLGQKRIPGGPLSPSFSRKITREVERKSERLTGLCAAGMYEDSLPIISELNSYVDNTINEILIFENYEIVADKIEGDANVAVAFCENKKVQDIADAKEAERIARAAEIEEEKEKRISAFEMLSSY